MDVVNVIEGKKLIEQNEVVLIDVRTLDEYNISHIKGARLLPLDEIEQWIDSLDKTKTYLLQCRSGGRSGIAQKYMHEKGYKVINLMGGIMDWTSKGFDIESEE